MEVLNYNFQQIQESFSHCKNLKDLILDIENELYSARCVVCKIIVNEILLNETDEQRLADSPLSSVQSLQIAYRSTDQLVEDSARDLCEWLQSFSIHITSQAEGLRQKGSLSAFEFSEIVAYLNWLTGALSALKSYISEENRLLVWTKVEQKMTMIVLELEEAYSSFNFSQVADILEYDISELMSLWKQTLQETI